MNPLQNWLGTMSALGRANVDGEAKPKVGYVTSYDPKTYAVRVRLEPESSANEAYGDGKVVETNWIPLSRAFGGDGWGLIAPPKANPNTPYGDMVLVLWPDGDKHGMAVGPFYTAKENPYKGAIPDDSVENTSADGEAPTAGEFFLVHRTGAMIVIKNDGSVLLRQKDGAYVKLDTSGNVEAKGKNGAQLYVSSGSPASLGSAGAPDGAVVTKKDLEDFASQVRTALGNKQDNSGSMPTFVIKGSTTVKVTD